MRTGRSAPSVAVLGPAVGLLCAALLCAALVPATPGGDDGWPVPIEPAAVQVAAGAEEGDDGQAADESTQSPDPVESPTAAVSPEPEPPSAPPGGPTPITRTPPGSPAHGGPPRTGASVRAGNAVLTSRYWSGQRTTSLTVTVTNLGNVTETITLRNAPPAGVQTASCPAGCAPHVPAGKSRTLVIGLLVDPGAWQSAPLSGRLDFTATASGAASRSGHVVWGVVFPPGPPTPGFTLHASDVHLDVAGGQPVTRGQLTVQLTNSGKAPGAGELTVVAPAGVTFGALPAACLLQGSSAIGCDTGVLGVGKSWEVLLTLLIPPTIGTDAPLVGLVRAKLTPYGQDPLLTQSSYQIVAASGQPVVAAGTSADPASAGAQSHRAARSVPVLPIIGGSVALLIVVVVGLALTLSRRHEGPAPDAAVDRSPAASGGSEGAGGQSEVTAMLSAGPVDRTPTPSGPVHWEWIEEEQPDPAPPAGPAAGDRQTHGN